MKRDFSALVFALIVVAATIAAFYYWRQLHPVPQLAMPTPPIPAAPTPETRPMLEAPDGKTVLPKLAESDGFAHDAIEGVVGNGWWMRAFRKERFIHNFVATIDNLPTRRAPMNVMPIEPAQGLLVATEEKGELYISPKNAERYAAYMKLVEVMDTKKLVALYIRLYPLFQQAYEELGYPKKYFNDRLLETLDDLLEAPDVKEPVKVVQPKVLYQFADPELEALSIGQRIMMRIGAKNEAQLKAKLRDIRQELAQHLRDTPVGPAVQR